MLLKFTPDCKVLFQRMGSSRSLTTLSTALCSLSKGLVVKSHLSSCFQVSPDSEQRSVLVYCLVLWKYDFNRHFLRHPVGDTYEQEAVDAKPFLLGFSVDNKKWCFTYQSVIKGNPTTAAGVCGVPCNPTRTMVDAPSHEITAKAYCRAKRFVKKCFL